jgi:hypothetical protein
MLLLFGTSTVRGHFLTRSSRSVTLLQRCKHYIVVNDAYRGNTGKKGDTPKGTCRCGLSWMPGGPYVCLRRLHEGRVRR